MSGETSGGAGDGRRVRRLTVAAVREPPGADHVEVLFLESARFYRLLRANPEFTAAVERLRASAAAGAPVAVTFAAEDEARIASVRPTPSSGSAPP